ncbi:hypothetical protein ACGFY8_15245 [Streptomyces sp. NPDC048232]|uniref:hypothetical protein n=1 Tax=Streptomyces sp. NPDC048232 TaxID=3365520 RepID=UPI00371DF8C5
MRRRRAAAAVLLAWALLYLLTPRPPVLAEASAERAAVTVAVVADTAGEPGPCEEDSRARHVAVRAPRAAGTAGADDGDAARAADPAHAARQHQMAAGRPFPARGRVTDGGARGVAALQTFRC